MKLFTNDFRKQTTGIGQLDSPSLFQVGSLRFNENPNYLTSRSPGFQKVLGQAKKLRNTQLAVLILGETGSGKEAMARYLWALEERPNRPFVPVHAGGLSGTLLESELFGHVKGAFTGATENKMGKFQFAHKGDFFLDEVGTMSSEIQQRFLRLLQNKQVTPVGSNQSIQVDCRIICATNENMERSINKGLFREDLYFRLAKVVIKIPPLRERKEDISDLIHTFLLRFSGGKKSLSKGAYEFCLDYPWPGNIRQLEGAIETASILTEDEVITEHDLVPHVSSLCSTSINESSIGVIDPTPSTFTFGLDKDIIKNNYRKLLVQFEWTMFRMAIEATGSESAAAKYLGLPRSTLVSWRKSKDVQFLE